MNLRSVRWLWITLPVVVAVWLLWPHHRRAAVGRPPSVNVAALMPPPAPKPPAGKRPAQRTNSPAPSAAATVQSSNAVAVRAAQAGTNRFPYRLSNSSKSLAELMHDQRAILLNNALIDTRNPLDLGIPKNLQAKGDPGAYIVQANGVITPGFRSELALAGAQIVSYIPNNAYLVQATAGQAASLAASGLTVLPYEPYYKLSSSLVAAAATQQPLPDATLLTIGAFASSEPQVAAEIEDLGGIIVGEDTSPFGRIYRVTPPTDWTALAQLAGVQAVEPVYRRVPANDLSREDLGVSLDTVTNANYLDLYGSNVVVEVNDTGIDAMHKDFTIGGSAHAGPGGGTRIFGDSLASLVDTNGHGTHVAGIIAGNGAMSLSPVNVGTFASGSVSNADFRGKAPMARLFSVGFEGNSFVSYGYLLEGAGLVADGVDGFSYDPLYNLEAGTYNPDIFDTSDYYLQTVGPSTNALISNNSWVYGGDQEYDLAAASYDAAVRDALPTSAGTQPELFVFAAGATGYGNDSGSGANPDTINSPATAKNVITVGALQQARNITNEVTDYFDDGSTNPTPVWQAETQSSTYVADYSSRGNVGIGVEGPNGRFKPDVVAPGNFVVSTLSEQFNSNVYYNPTGYLANPYLNQLVVSTNGEQGLSFYNVSVPQNAVSLTVEITPNSDSPTPFPNNFPIYFELDAPPDPYDDPTDINFLINTNVVSIPQDIPQDSSLFQSMVNDGGIWVAVADPTNYPVNFDIDLVVTVTNEFGSYFQSLSDLNSTLGRWYMYRSGTSMSAASVSGMLALMQDFFTNSLHLIPSPALLKGMLINGARAVGGYPFAITNAPNDQGWGLPNLPNSLPSAWAAPLRASPSSGPYTPPLTNSLFFQDQSVNSALATGDSQTFNVVLSPEAQSQPLRVTLTWTDPPGDPAAALKLVNNLDIIVTNLDSVGSSNGVFVYYGNNFSSEGSPNFSVPEGTNETANYDVVNNVRNVFLAPALGTNYTVTVIGRSVNVNAVMEQTNSVVQDYALVISSGDGYSGITNAFTVTPQPKVTNPTGGQDITYLTTTNTPLLNQIAGENSPLLGTNTVAVGANSLIGANGQVTIGMTNQWHFYVVTNTLGYTNAAFITFFPYELSVSRMGTLDDTVSDATRPQGDIDLYVAKEPGLLNLDPTVISNCVNGIGGDSVSASQGGTEFVAYSNSVLNEVYYVGVKSEDHLGTEYGFLAVFSQTPFSQMNKDGSESVNGLVLPVNIPPGSPQHPTTALIFALATYPMTLNQVIVTNAIWDQNFGDLSGQLTHGSTSMVLNSHDGYGNTTYYPLPGTNIIYYDAGANPINTPIGPVYLPNPPTRHHSDGPGSLVSYQGQSAIGPWILAEVDNSPYFTGSNEVYGLRLYPHTPASKGLTVYIAGQSAYEGYVDVPAGVTNMTFNVTNETIPTTPLPLEVYMRYNAVPTPTPDSPPAPPPLPTVYDYSCVVSNGVAPYVGGTISVGPASIPPINPGRYYYEIYNPSLDPATNVYIVATFEYQAVPDSATFSSTAQTTILDDAVATNTIVITNQENIYNANVEVVVDYPRVSDLTLNLISPLNQRYTLIENRGGATANMGHLDITTNFFGTVSAGNQFGNTNVLGPIPRSGTLIVNYDMYTVPDEMDVYYDGVDIFDSGYVANTGQFVIPYGPGTATNLVIIMDKGGDQDGTSLWTYTPAVVNEDYNYLTFTDDTNLTTTPIKFAIPPFDLSDDGTNYVLNNFESATNGDYYAPTNIYDARGGWNVFTSATNFTANFTNGLPITNIVALTNNLVSVITDPAGAFDGSNYLALGLGTITRVIPTIPNRQYTITYAYRGPGIAGWWRGEGNALDSSSPETNGNNGQLIGRFSFPEGEVGLAFGLEDLGDLYQFAGTNNYVQIPQASGLNVGTGAGLTIEGWINPTNLSSQEPVVEWLSSMPTNAVNTNYANTNLVILAGPFLNRETDHFYYLLAQTNWTTSEQWATNMGGHLVTIRNADEQAWIYDTFANYGGTNRNLWLGLNDTNASSLTWTSGETPAYYDWATGQPADCTLTEHFTIMLGPTNTTPGLWVLADERGGFCTNNVYHLFATNGNYGVVELNAIPTNGVQLWVSVTNSPATGNSILSSNGCLYANLIDTTNGNHEIWSAPGLIQSNIYQHVALTYNTNTGIATLYYQGTNVCATNLGVFTPKTTGDVLLGKDMSLLTNNFYSGALDEMSIYGRCLSDAEIAGIYEISAWSTNNPGTNGQVIPNGKFDPQYNPAIGLAVADVTLAGRSAVIVGDNTNWQVAVYTFVAQSNSAEFQITGVSPGILLDDFTVTEAALGNIYYEPEQPLDDLVGESAAGTWTLEILNNRTNSSAAAAKLVSWQLQLVLVTNTPIATTLYPEMPATNTVPPGYTAYFYVPIPGWAGWATNLLVSSTGPVSLLFNPTTPPTGSNPGDLTMLANSTGGVGLPVLQTNTLPLTTNYYYLGVTNSGAVPVQFVVEVNFDITELTNGVPVEGVLATNQPVRYFSFDVSTNSPLEATFQLLKLSGNADLVASYGTPLPNTTNGAYGSFNATNADQNIYIQTNSTPVPLMPGRWYLGVFRNDPGPVTYSILAKELDATQTNVVTLTNNVPLRFTAAPGAALTNFFVLNVTNAAQNLFFKIYDMSGDVDLTVQTNGMPLMPPYYTSSQEPGLIPEYVYIRTNNLMTNLMGQWYLGVPNHETNQVSFTILAVNESTLITNTVAAFPGAVGAAVYVTGGRGSTNIYHVTNLGDSGAGSLRYGLNSLTNTGNIIFDVSGNIALASPLVVTNSNLTVAGQTAPGDGITLQNYPTLLQGASNVIVRYLRFRPGDTGTNYGAFTNVFVGDSLAFTNAFDVMIDHVTASWSSNAVLSVMGSSNITVQWSMIADSFYGTNLSQPGVTNVLGGQGSTLRYGQGSLTFYHNLYANNYNSSPGLGDNLVVDFVNNIVYNWGNLPMWSVTNNAADYPAGSTNEVNVACNYFLASANTLANYIAFWSGGTNTWVFQTNNYIDAYTNEALVVTPLETNLIYVLNGSDTGWGMFTTNLTRVGDPFPLPYPEAIPNATTPSAAAEEAGQAYEKVLDFAGDQLSRDSADKSLVRQVRTQSGAFIYSQSQVGGWPSLNSLPALPDTDQDGLPDYWEITFGLNPTNALDGAMINTNTGYSQLETYLNWLASPHAVTTETNAVGVDLYQLAGGTGRLSFFVTNAVNGSVALTNDYVTNYFYNAENVYTNDVVTYSNVLAIFTPSNNYLSSFTNPASFQFYVTNNDTTAWFGPETVTVVVSATNIYLASTVITLTNGMPYTGTNDPVFKVPVSDSPGAMLFQVYNLSSAATLAIQTNGAPVAPNYLAASSNTGTNPIQILVATNAALASAGAATMSHLNDTWYLDLLNDSTNPLVYTIVAKEIPVSPTVITLTNNEPFTWTSGAGPELTNFFRYNLTNRADAVQFVLYDQSGDGQLTAQTNALPFAPEYYAISQQSPGGAQIIQAAPGTGSLWFLGVPDNDPSEITYTVVANESASLATVIPTNSTTNTITQPGGVQYYLVPVPEYADVASNLLFFATGDVDLWFSTNTPPTFGAPDDALLLQNVTSGLSVFGASPTPELIGDAQLTPGGYYYLAVYNASSGPVTYALGVRFGLAPPSTGAPVVFTLPATNITAFTATLPASVQPEGSATTVYFVYGTNTSFGNVAGPFSITNSLFSAWPIGASVTNLMPGNLYYFEAIAYNSFGTNYGGILTFSNGLALPAIVTETPTGVTASAATLQAQVNPNGSDSAVWFAYGTNTSYGLTTAPVQQLGNLYSSQPASTAISGLLPGVTYHYRAIATNSVGTNYGLDVAFTTSAQTPSVTTAGSSNIKPASASLQASVDPNGAAATVYFEYGPTAAFGSNSSSTALTANLNSAQPVTLSVASLLPGVTYYYQAVGSNAAGVGLGGILTFTTPAIAPTVVTLPATNVMPGAATLPALVTPNGAATTVYFNYGASTQYGSHTSAGVLNNNLNTAQIASSLLTGLLPGSVYHFQAVAANSAGTNYGADVVFTNPAVSITLSVTATNNGYLLSWYAPTNYAFRVQWSSNLAANWSTFTNIVTYTGPVTPTNGLFTFFDDGSQTGGFSADRFYRLSLVVVSGVPTAPSVTTLPATNVAPGSATLQAAVTPNGASATVYFAWGPSTNYGNVTAATALTGNLYSSQPVTNILTGLLPGVVYHYQAIAANSAGTNYGGDLTFTNPYQTALSFGIVATNGGYLITWSAPTNYEFKVQWSTNLAVTNWSTFTNIVTYTGPITATNGVFMFFDNGSQTGGFSLDRFYRFLELAGIGSIPPTLSTNLAVYEINPLSTLVVTNTAGDLNPNAILSYVATQTLTGANVPVVATNNGVVTVAWTPTLAQAGLTNFITTTVTDSSEAPVQTANTFEVIVFPLASFTSVQIGVEGVILQWASVPQNQFQIGWATNLAGPWVYAPTTPPYLSSVSTNFTYQDTNPASGTKFYILRVAPGQ